MGVEGSLHSVIAIAVTAVLVVVDVVQSLSVLNIVLLFVGSLHQHHGKT